MPRYDWRCMDCGKEAEHWARMDDRELICSCGGLMTRLFSPPRAVICDYEPYFDENLTPPGSTQAGTWVTSRQHRKQLMKEYGLYERG